MTHYTSTPHKVMRIASSALTGHPVHSPPRAQKPGKKEKERAVRHMCSCVVPQPQRVVSRHVDNRVYN
ncbi:hypothetical protein LSM04_006992 [Trypanosoma melophagium]|uniref:uncharacterized protein n=1 Tax=Trypanosoma melophagium TaxID=715481 RepID=UPI00351A1522|nr:hypothetical protein LSM04_006992 [Trypanosoma melophagium]